MGKKIASDAWRCAAKLHAEKVGRVLQGGLVQVGSLELDPKHPVFNFLRAYYGLNSSKEVRRLTRWSPGVGVELEDAELPRDAEVIGASTLWKKTERKTLEVVLNEVSKEKAKWHVSRLNLVGKTAPVLHCFGLHEWAMLYGQGEKRDFQDHIPLRVSQAEIDRCVEERGVNCTHFDAMRFFTKEAIPFSKYHPPATFSNEAEKQRIFRLDNPACLHATMDLFNLCVRMIPILPSDLLVEALELALDARKIDVRASPYDASQFQLEPIKIETLQGKREYQQQQLALMPRSKELREKIMLVLSQAVQGG